MGRRVVKTAGGTTIHYAYDDDLMTYSGSNQFGWDENGRLTSDQSRATSYYYNWDGKLRDVNDSSDNPLVSLIYDPIGNRVWKRVSPDNNPTSTNGDYFMVDGGVDLVYFRE